MLETVVKQEWMGGHSYDGNRSGVDKGLHDSRCIQWHIDLLIKPFLFFFIFFLILAGSVLRSLHPCLVPQSVACPNQLDHFGHQLD